MIFLLSFLINWILYADGLFYDNFQDRLEVGNIQSIIRLKDRVSSIYYILIPLIYLIKFSLIIICLSCYTFLLRLEVGLKPLFKIALLAEFIFLLPPLIKLFWFSFINVNYTLNDLQFFSPLSAINLFDRAIIEPWLVYPLRLINLFEVAYIISLTCLLARVLESSFLQSLKIVVVSYGTGLLIWVVFITFLTVSLSA